MAAIAAVGTVVRWRERASAYPCEQGDSHRAVRFASLASPILVADPKVVSDGDAADGSSDVHMNDEENRRMAQAATSGAVPDREDREDL